MNCHTDVAEGLPNMMDSDELKALLEKLVRKIWKQKGTPAEIDKALTQFFASEYWKAIEKGYGVNIDDIDFDTPDYEMLKKLEENVYQFASAKNYTQIKAISQALIDEEGKLRTFSAFRTAAAEINNQFVNQWLQAEYNYAVASSQMASRWQQIQSNKETLPLLRYDTVGDERVRLEHQELDDVVRPVDDPFWDLYYPPNGWNCRCDVQQLDRGKITPLNKISFPDRMSEMFKYNAGKKGIAFPPNHPYYDGIPADIKKQGDDLYNDNGKTADGNTQ